jgi:hypothetical protein
VNGAALVTLNYAPVDPDNKGTPLWDLWAAGQGGASGSCCYSGTSVTLKFTSAGVWRVSVGSIDRYLEGSSLATADRKTAVVSIGGVTGTPPLATASLSALSGPAPFTVTVDMKGSLAFDGKSISNYFISCGEGFVAGGSGTARSCTFDTPGTYWLLEQIQDSAGLMDLVSLYVVVTPPNVGGGGDTTPPTVSITSPSANSKLNGTAVPVAANATDNPGGLGMKNVVFRLDDPINGSIIATVLGAGPTFTTNWNTVGVADGAHMLYAIATDNANLSTTSSGIAVVVDNTAPTVSITSPSPNAILKGTQQISANPTDNAGGSGIKNVVFRLDNPTSGVIINTVSGPFTTNWDTTGVADGSHMLFAIASDNANNSTTSSGISVMVDNNGPTVSITQPTGTSPVFGTISIVASASDSPGTGVKNVVFWVDNATLGNPVTSPPYSVSWNTKLYSDAPHTLKAVATDNNGNSTTSAPVTVTVDNTIQPPTITLGFSPAPAKKATVTITATATPSTGAKITKVDFYINGVLVGTDTTSAYTYTWKVPASAGKTYNISAIVTDSAGQTATATTSVNP